MKTKRTLSRFARRAKVMLLLATCISLVGTLPTTTRAATVSDLLEQGIYSEETKGDLKAAMALYQQVVQEANAAEDLAARAQYRLGVCYYKLGDYEQAAAAFEKLLQDYPEQERLVRMASQYLAGAVSLLPAPWVDGEEMRLTIQTATGYEIGFLRYAVHSATLEGQKIWRLSSQLVAGPKQVSQVDVTADSFQPLHCLWKHSLFGEADITYADGKAEVKLTGKDEVTTADLTGVVYDNEEVIQLIRRLPLSPDYVTTLRVFTGLGGARVLPIEAKVTAQETVEVPAGTFDCFRLHLNLVNQTFWYSTDEHHYLVKLEAGGITGELSSVEKLTAEQIDTQASEAFDFQLGDTSDGLPTVQPRDAQSFQKQAKLLILGAAKLGKPLNVADWCDVLKENGSGMPELNSDTCFALNSAAAGRSITDLPGDTVVFFETATPGWNQAGGAELLAEKSMGVAVALADGRVLSVDPSGTGQLRWTP